MSKTAAAVVEEEDEELMMEEEVEAPAPPKKKTAPTKKDAPPAPQPPSAKKKAAEPKKKAPKKRDRAAEKEDEEPAGDEEAPPKQKKERVKHKPRARGDRLKTAPVYRTHLNKDRQRRKEEAIKAGKEVPATHRKSKPGTVTAREIEFLNKANGLYLTTALARRLAVHAIGQMVPVLREENELIKVLRPFNALFFY
jgi:hypothetical protein